MGCDKVTYDEPRYPPARGSDSATSAKGCNKDTVIHVGIKYNIGHWWDIKE